MEHIHCHLADDAVVLQSDVGFAIGEASGSLLCVNL